MGKDRFSQPHIKVRRTLITGPSRVSIDIEVLADLKRRFPDAQSVGEPKAFLIL